MFRSAASLPARRLAGWLAGLPLARRPILFPLSGNGRRFRPLQILQKFAPAERAPSAKKFPRTAARATRISQMDARQRRRPGGARNGRVMKSRNSGRADKQTNGRTDEQTNERRVSSGRTQFPRPESAAKIPMRPHWPIGIWNFHCAREPQMELRPDTRAARLA